MDKGWKLKMWMEEGGLQMTGTADSVDGRKNRNLQ